MLSGHLPKEIGPAVKDAFENQKITWTNVHFRPKGYYGHARIALVGDTVGHFHPLTAGGLTMGFVDAECLAQSKDLEHYRKRRIAQTYVPELLSNALYQVFIRDDDSARAIRETVLDAWRHHPKEPARTMRILTGANTNSLNFTETFFELGLKAALPEISKSIRSGSLADTAETVLDFARWMRCAARAPFHNRPRASYCEPPAELGPIGLALNWSTQRFHRVRLLDTERRKIPWRRRHRTEKAVREIRRKTRLMPYSVDATPEPSWRQRAERWLEADAKTIPGARWLRTGLRTLHLIAVGALYGGHLYAVDVTRLQLALFSVLLTGGLLVCFEVWQARIWLVQLRGVATFLKLGLLAGTGLVLDLTVVLLTLALVIGSISSHMPSRWRYHSVLHGRVAGPTEKG